MSSRDSELAIRVRDLRKAYGSHRAVDGIDLDIRRGEIFALLGPNGAGKTTTTEILEGHRTRDSGQVDVLGEDPAVAGSGWRARVGIVLQQANDFADWTVEEAVGHFAHYYPLARDPDEVIEAVGLAGQARSRASRLSGGQRRRLDVALGIIGSPELLFLDEPTTGFDPQARRQFWALIAGLRSEGVTVVLTTHYLDEAEHLADRVAVIAGGRILDVNTPSHLGGRQRRTTRVSWSSQEGPRTVETDTPTRLVRELVGQLHGEVAGLTVTRPTLEDVYLDMIGARP